MVARPRRANRGGRRGRGGGGKRGEVQLAVYRGNGGNSGLIVLAPDGTLRRNGAPISWMHNYLFFPLVFKAGLAFLFVWCVIKGINRLNDYSPRRRRY